MYIIFMLTIRQPDYRAVGLYNRTNELSDSIIGQTSCRLDSIGQYNRNNELSDIIIGLTSCRTSDESRKIPVACCNNMGI